MSQSALNDSVHIWKTTTEVKIMLWDQLLNATEGFAFIRYVIPFVIAINRGGMDTDPNNDKPGTVKQQIKDFLLKLLGDENTVAEYLGKISNGEDIGLLHSTYIEPPLKETNDDLTEEDYCTYKYITYNKSGKPDYVTVSVNRPSKAGLRALAKAILRSEQQPRIEEEANKRKSDDGGQ
jgi:hypothetical protein